MGNGASSEADNEIMVVLGGFYYGSGSYYQCGFKIYLSAELKHIYIYIYIYIGISEGGGFYVKGEIYLYISIYMYLSEGGGWGFAKQFGNVILIILGLVGLFNKLSLWIAKWGN